MKLSTWARQAGVRPRIAYGWFHTGVLPVPARQRRTGTVLVEPPLSSAGEVAADEVGSAACGNRRTLWRLFERFGVEYVEAAVPLEQRSGSGLELAARGRQIVVLDNGEVAAEVVGHVVEVGTSMSARRDGRRWARRRAQRAVEAVGEASW